MWIIGHRGAAALEPENTLLAMDRAVRLGVDAVEFDVRLTKDDHLVVIHDATVDRTTNGKGLVSQYTLEELKRLDAGKGERVPSLKEVVDHVAGRAGLVIELKDHGTERRVAELIREADLYEQTYVISFWHRLVKSVKEMDSRIRTGVLLVGCPAGGALAAEAGADALVMKYDFVDRALVDRAHDDGLLVFVWNIDDPQLLQPYADMGVDAIASNDPSLLVEHFRASTKVPGSRVHGSRLDNDTPENP